MMWQPEKFKLENKAIVTPINSVVYTLILVNKYFLHQWKYFPYIAKDWCSFPFLFLITGARYPPDIHQIVGNYGTITSPNFPNYYPNYHITLWNITSPSGKQIKLNFTFFRLANPSVICHLDFVQIQDGALPSGDVIVRLCGQQPPGKTVFSSGQHLLIHFETDSRFSNAGFQASYEAVSK